MARGIAIIMIVITHSLSQYSRSFFSALLFAVNVPIFFILSGYLFKEKRFSDVIKNACRNLLLPYFSTVALIGLIKLVGHNFVPNWISPIGVVQYIVSALYGLGTNSFIPGIKVTVSAIGAIWFLPAMFVGKIVFNAAFKLSKKFVHAKTLLLIFSLALTVLGFLLSKKIQLPWSFDAALISQSFYCFGYMVRQLNLIERGKLLLDLAGLLFWVFSAESGFFYMNIGYADSPILATLGAVGGSYFIMRVCCLLMRSQYQWPVFRKYGKDSLVMLCFHLIDLNAFLIGPRLFNKVVTMSGKIEVAIVVIICYRLFVIWVASIIVPHIPVIRSFFFPRKFPFKVKDKQSLVKNSLR